MPFSYFKRRKRLNIELKTLAEIEKMRAPAQAAAKTLSRLRLAIQEGERSIPKLDQLAEETLRLHGANPAFKGYKPPFGSSTYKYTICASVNSQVVHTPPTPGRNLLQGDIVSLDIGAEIDGWYADIAITVPVGDVHVDCQNLILATHNALTRAIEKAQVGNTPAQISSVFSKIARLWDVSPVHDLSGHGIGRSIHEGPSIQNRAYTPFHPEPTFREGVVICIEPMFCNGSGKVESEGDWTIKTVDGSRAAHFEHVVAITNKGPQVLSDLEE